ncbi:MAG: hypothetical protein AAF471_03320 [Myxococcota bacterium]
MLPFIETAAALPAVYKLGFPIKEENIVELSPEQYASLERQGGDMSKKWYRVTRGMFEDCNNPPAELLIVNEREANSLLRATALIMSTSEDSKRTFNSFQERLDYCKGVFPSIFALSEDDEEKPAPTQDGKPPKLRVIKGGKDS